MSIDKVYNKHIDFWLYLSNDEVSRRMDEFLQMIKENKIAYDIYSKINNYKKKRENLYCFHWDLMYMVYFVEALMKKYKYN